MTEKLFYLDSHLQRFSAQVEQCVPDGENWQIVLDRTAFFPEGGGQYADTGILGSARVLDVQEKDGVIFHRTDAPLSVGDCVEGRIDWDLRFMKMQQHTGEHIVSGLVHKRFGYQNVGFHLGSEDCTMDFNGEITKEEIREIEWEANRAVVRNLEVEVTYPDQKVLQTLVYRSKIEIEGQVRLAVRENPHFQLSLHEAKKDCHSYTYKTLQEFHALYPENEYFFILGADSLFSIEQWKYFKEIFPSCTILAAMRDDKDSFDMQRQIQLSAWNHLSCNKLCSLPAR